MKTTFILAMALTVVAFTTITKKEINIQESTIQWTGEKIIGDAHLGTLSFKEGHLEMEGDQLIGGSFMVDMTSINVTDMEGEYKGKLEGHLKSDDFFGVADHPTATLVINSAKKYAEGYHVNGDITIKGATRPIDFDLKMGDGPVSASIEIDRTKFDVRYGSGSFFDNLGDNAISDTFTLDVTLKF